MKIGFRISINYFKRNETGIVGKRTKNTIEQIGIIKTKSQQRKSGISNPINSGSKGSYRSRNEKILKQKGVLVFGRLVGKYPTKKRDIFIVMATPKNKKSTTFFLVIRQKIISLEFKYKNCKQNNMKKNFTQTIKSYKLLFIAAMVAFGCLPAMAQLSGTYTIDATKSASATNYVSFNDAVADLLTATRTSGTANGPGVKGAVVFKVANGTYDEAIQIDTITGATAAHNITFESASGDSSKVILKDTAGGYTVYLNGADFITFKKMTIWHDVANGQVIQIDGNADSNRFLNNRLIGMKVSGYSYPYPCVVYSGTYPYTDDSSNWFINNTMENGVYSVYMLGDYNTSGELGNRFVGNQVSGAFEGGFMLIYQDHITVTHNKININSSSAYYGVYIYSYKASSGDSSLVANNMISVIGNTYSYGLMAFYLNLGNIYNNSIYTQSSSGYAAYLYNNSTLNVINNNFVNMGGGYAISAYSPSWSDYNNFYVTGSNLGQFNYSTVADLAAWQSASSQDANSYSVDPLYKSKVNLHTGNVKLNNTGNSVPSVKDDIDGELRGAKPDIGADEFTPKADDAGVVSIDSPGNGSCGGSINTYVTVFNFGTSVLKKFDINWTINGVAQTAYSYSSATGISIGGKQQFNLGAHTFATGSTFNIVSYTSKPNGVADSVPANDTTKTIFATNGMKGTFTIGSTGNYTTFTAAVADLVSKGVCAATTFNVDDATYSETVSIPSIPGAGPVNTITFKSAKGDSTKVILDWPVSSTYGDYALQFNNASYIYFDKMTITRSGSGNYGNVIDVRGGTHNISVSNSIIHSVNGTYSMVIYSGQDDDSFNTFRNNAIYNGYYGVYFYGGYEKGNVFEYNTIDSVQYYGIMLYYNANFSVSNNLIKGIQTQYGAGLYSYSYNIYGSSKINNNKIILDNGGYGLFCYYLLGTTGDSAYITNNFVSVAAGTNGYGLYFIYSDYANFYHNNVNIHNSNSSSFAAYFANYSSVTSNRVYNNNLVNIAGGYALVSTNSTITDEDYNNYYVGSTSAYVAMWNGTSCTTLSDLQTNNSMDANSMSIDPKYRDKRNLHILNVALNGKAMPIGVSKDIDGQTRNGSKPDVGADEIFPVANDAGVLTIDSPLLGFCAGTRDVYARVFNFGTANLTSCTVNWTINGTTQTPVTFSGSLTVGGSALVKLGSNAFSAATKYTIVSYTTSPNGVADVVHDNDTASSLIQTGLSGTLTIGSSGIYSTFSAAATDLNTRGVCAATTIVVDDGFYPEQIVLDHVPGTTTIKTVTFTSKSADSSKVVLDYPSGSSSANYVVYLKGSSFIKFEKMTISRSVGSKNSYGNVVVVDGGSSFNTFTNDVLQSVPVSGYAYMSYVVYSAGDNDSFNTFNNSIIRHGTYGFYWFGPSSSQMETGTLIQGNLMDSSAYGNYLWYQDGIRLKNNVLRDYNYYALMAYYWSNGCQITGNKISADKYFGLYLYNAQGYSDTIFIANNMITTNLQYTFYGVAQLYYSDNIAFVFNSVQCTNAGNVTYFYNGSTPGNISVYNNILTLYI
ncbi:MAG: right-handed parallel beta-helix repeat-containing protein [Bacteroidetes bacterium]|nr:right-handed parallel beta-helix repeat-containing protein [Bacteroidota bacterium]